MANTPQSAPRVRENKARPNPAYTPGRRFQTSRKKSPETAAMPGASNDRAGTRGMNVLHHIFAIQIGQAFIVELAP
jgi:hypothetical protein